MARIIESDGENSQGSNSAKSDDPKGKIPSFAEVAASAAAKEKGESFSFYKRLAKPDTKWNPELHTDRMRKENAVFLSPVDSDIQESDTGALLLAIQKEVGYFPKSVSKTKFGWVVCWHTRQHAFDLESKVVVVKSNQKTVDHSGKPVVWEVKRSFRARMWGSTPVRTPKRPTTMKVKINNAPPWMTRDMILKRFGQENVIGIVPERIAIKADPPIAKEDLPTSGMWTVECNSIDKVLRTIMIKGCFLWAFDLAACWHCRGKGHTKNNCT